MRETESKSWQPKWALQDLALTSLHELTLKKIIEILSRGQANVNLSQSASLREVLMKHTGYNFNRYCYCYNDSAFHLKGIFLLNKIGRQQMSKSYKCPRKGSQSLFKVLPFKIRQVD